MHSNHFSREEFERHATRFWAKVRKTDSCWLWTAYKRPAGYGIFSIGRHNLIAAHRFSYELETGVTPGKLQVCHKCDNPPCVRPDHLFLGTFHDNIADMVRKGRQRGAIGEANSHARLKSSDVVTIRTLLGAGAEVAELAERFGVAPCTIYHIKTGYTWRHV